MGKKYVASTIIKAPRDLVWEILTDFDSYPEWNPLNYKFETTWNKGEKVIVHYRWGMNAKVRQNVEEVIEFKAPETIAYGDYRFYLKAERWQTLEIIDATTTKYHTLETFNKLLSPLIVLLFGEKVQAGLSGAADALKERAEEYYKHQG